MLVHAEPSERQRVYATFDLTGLATGPYNVQVVENGITKSLPQAFDVIAGPPDDW